MLFFSECIGTNGALGMESGNITTEQIAASSIRADLQIDSSRYECCLGKNLKEK